MLVLQLPHPHSPPSIPPPTLDETPASLLPKNTTFVCHIVLGPEIRNKGSGKKNVAFQILIFNFLVNRWSQEAVLLRTRSTHEYSKS